MFFAYEAMRADGTLVTDRLEAGGYGEAVESLREKGLVVMKLDQQADEPRAAGPSANLFARNKLTNRDLILFTRQMKMLLESGSPLVPALEATRSQTGRPFTRELVGRLRERVEEGDSLSEAIEAEQDSFDPVFRSMIAAGESTGSLPQVFGQLCNLAYQQQQVRKQVLGAAIYPAVLCVLLTGVVSILLFFVVPRFKTLFENLNSPLPSTTLMLFELSEWLKTGWPYVLAGLLGTVIALVVCFRMPATRAWLDGLILKLPLIGPLASRLILARVIRIWAAMLRCHVPLLDAIKQSRDAVTNAVYARLLGEVQETVASGGRMGQAIGKAKLADPIICSAITTGEENGRLGEAADFVSNWLEEDNANAVQQVTRLAEPLLLALMGLVVGFVAMSLFVPLFDLATAAG